MFITKLDDLVKPLLSNLRLGLLKSPVLALDHRTPHDSLPRLVTLHALFQRNIKKEDDAWNLKPLCQFKVFLAKLGSERGGIHHAQPVQAQAQLGEAVHQGKGLGLETLIPLIITHSRSRPVRRDDLSGAKVPFSKG